MRCDRGIIKFPVTARLFGYCGRGMPIPAGPLPTAIVEITAFVDVSMTDITLADWLTTNSRVPSGVTAKPGTPK